MNDTLEGGLGPNFSGRLFHGSGQIKGIYGNRFFWVGAQGHIGQKIFFRGGSSLIAVLTIRIRE